MVTHSPSSTITELTQLIDLVLLRIVRIYSAIMFFFLLHMTCFPFIVMCSSFLPFFRLRYRSFFFIIAHLSLIFLNCRSFIACFSSIITCLSLHVTQWHLLVLSSVGLNWNLDKVSSKASSGGFKGIKVELRGRHAFLCLNIWTPWHCLNHLQTRDNENKVPQRELTFYWCTSPPQATGRA